MPGTKIDDATIKLIRDLLADKISHRQIALRSGVGRSTIGDISTGKYRRQKAPVPWLLVFAASKKPIFCPACQAWVKVPCVACAARKSKHPHLNDEGEILQLDLAPAEQQALENLGQPADSS